MATLKSIRTRIHSVKNTQKITKAMKVVAAVKLRRAQSRLIASRPYVAKIQELLASMAQLIEGCPHPVFETREEVKKIEVMVVTSDRGLCGGFNNNLLRRVDAFLREKRTSLESVKVTVLGRKGREYLRARKVEPEISLPAIREDVPFDEAFKTANDLIQGFQSKRFDEFYLAYNYFHSAISQEVRIEKVLPLSLPEVKFDHYVPEYIYEPSRDAVLSQLVPRAIAMVLRRAMLESVAGEHGARMMAMDNATTNSKELIFDLTLEMNRIRQAAITTELMDIVNGAESLKG